MAFLVLFSIIIQPRSAAAAAAAWRVSSAQIAGGNIVIDLKSGRKITIRPDDNESTLENIQVGDDRRTVGWVVSGDVTELGKPGEKPIVLERDIPSALVVWRAGRVIHVFDLFGGVVRWKFWQAGRDIAFHLGPLHFDSEQGSELHSSESGRKLRQWEASDHTPVPAWARGLVDETYYTITPAPSPK